MNWEAFFTIHQDLPREGPGEPDDIAWAREHLDLKPDCQIADLACGPGADLEAWGYAMPGAQITGIEKHPSFVAQAQARVASFDGRVTARQGDMTDPGGPFDLIWCAGAIYFLGVTEGLTLWKEALEPDGAVVFSEPIWLSADRPEAAALQWAEYPAMTDVQGLNTRIENAGYRVEAQRVLSDQAWENYYTPIDTRIAKLRGGAVTPELAQVLSDAEDEAMIWRQHRRAFGYILSIVRPV